MLAAAVVIAAAAAAQAVAAHALGSAWWVPQLALIALFRRISRMPRAWLPLAAVSGAVLTVVSVRWAGAVLVLLIALAGAWRAAMWYWDTADPRLQALVAGAAAGVLVGVTAALDQALSWPVLGLIGWQAAWTAAAAALWAAVRPEPS